MFASKCLNNKYLLVTTTHFNSFFNYFSKKNTHFTIAFFCVFICVPNNLLKNKLKMFLNFNLIKCIFICLKLMMMIEAHYFSTVLYDVCVILICVLFCVKWMMVLVGWNWINWVQTLSKNKLEVNHNTNCKSIVFLDNILIRPINFPFTEKYSTLKAQTFSINFN